MRLFILVLFAFLINANSVMAGELLPVIPKASKGDSCVQPVDEMRKNHMNYILHQRVETVHDGIRTPEYSFTGCIDCHATKNDQGDYVSVESSEHFCSACHTYAAVKVDCFQCHSDKPTDSFEHAKSNIHSGGQLTLDTVNQTVSETSR